MFEIITNDGNRFRYESQKYRWQYALQQGSIDKLDRSIVEVLLIDDEGGLLHKAFTSVIAAGDVHEDTCLVMPREPLILQCPRCGHCKT